jgi:hypothetical protein
MGQNQTKNYQFPSGIKYNISYCRQYNISEKLLSDFCFHKTDVDLSNIVEETGISGCINYKLAELGYSFKTDIEYSLQTLNEFLLKIKILDLGVKWKCYMPTLDNIKYLLFQGNVLLAGIVIDNDLKKMFGITENNSIFSDIVLIVGYNQTDFILKTTWQEDLVNIPFDFVGDFKEIWNIELENPEDKFLNYPLL